MKKTILHILLDFVFLVVFNVLFFVIGGTEHIATVWISYGFIHLAYITILGSVFLVRKNKFKAVWGLSLFSISSVYFFLEFIIGILFVLKINTSFKLALAVQLVLAGIYISLLLINLIANEHTADKVEKQYWESWYVKETSSRIKFLIGKFNNKELDKKIENIYDLMYGSPAQSNLKTQELETQIISVIESLENAEKNTDISDLIVITDKLSKLIQERNRILKVHN